ncbi:MULTISPECIES: TonB-dependent receptor [unclassified Sphingobacterium]|uniref:SusC/RagA family TonB-linked outer membrane protein n=1 Tax=unclassified Sphingobacterium TaxID=2609468 RepID=UPI001044E546|nr:MULTISPECIES: TonB-dependent receptor [unclassified Sphingobacterium]MCS3552759.1 TonB-linked SusC/RagA family outer membrane protein [Sphingobacterium sp. JUb21]TCR10483.1 TonB-linked SusC/RagA family outer membrane protein [Sphingobacterium sp. JUb20]
MKTHINRNRLWGKAKSGLLLVPVINFLAVLPLSSTALENREISLSLLAKQDMINGRIVDPNGNALAGVEIKNLTTGYVSSSAGDGSYVIKGSKTDKLQFRLIGFTSQVLRANEAASVTLISSVEALDEVVVVGYGTQKKANLTGAVSSVQFNESTTSRPTMNLSSALVGMSSGLNISQTSAAPGAEGFNVLVRGKGTMNDASPLVIIDGVPGALNDVNPNDVENVSILKDASSSAIYGSRAANGVILVTTKRGKEDKFTVTYSGYAGRQSASKNIGFITDMATHMELVNESEGREKYPNTLIEEWRRESAAGNPLYPNTDWYDEMLKSSMLTEHNLSVRGGGQKGSFAMSLGYLDNKGIIDNSNFKRYNFRINADSKIKNFLTLGGNVFGSWSDRGPVDVSSFFSSIRNTTPGVIPVYEDGRYGGEMFKGLPAGSNPRAYVDNTRGNYEKQRLGLKFFGIVNILKNLEWESSFGFNYGNNRDWEYVRPYSLWNFQTDFEYQKKPSVNSLFNGSRRDYSTVLNTLMRYRETFNESHNLAVLFGFDQQYNRMDKFDAKKNDILGDDAIYILDAGANLEAINGSGTDDALQSYFGRVNYDYKGKYLFEANARYDGSSRFAKENRWGFFPSFSAGWRVLEESFAQGLKSTFSDIKIRGSWGRLGNNRIGDYTYQVVYGSYLYPFGGQLQQGVAPKELANSKIKWETTTITNVGVDLALLKNRLTLTVEYFDKTTSDILTKIPIPLVLGNFSPPWQNIAEMKNKGMEFQLGYQGKIGRDLTYHIAGNLSTVNNKVTKFNGSKSINAATITQENNAFNSYYLLEFDRIIQDQAEIDQLLADGYTFGTYVGGVPKPGDMLYKDTNGDKIFNDQDRVVKAYSALPKITYGLNMNVGYKGFDLSVIGQGTGGVKEYWGNDGFNTFNINEGFLQREEILNRWTPENKSKEYPRLLNSGSALNTMYSDYWLYNTSYFRIKSLQLGYALPQAMTSKFKVDRLRVYANLENYFTFTTFKGYNPENASVSYPLMKQWVVGLNVTF